MRRTPPDELPLFAFAAAAELGPEPDPALPAMAPVEEVVADYQTTRLSLKAHPLDFLRARLRGEGVLSCAEVNAAPEGRRVRTAGVVLVRQRPGKGNAVFITLEDESGIVNALLWARDMEHQRAAVMAARLMQIEGTVQRSEEGVVHLMARRIVDRSSLLDQLTEVEDEDEDGGEGEGEGEGWNESGPEEDRAPPPASVRRHPRDVRVLPRSRDFH